MLLHNKTFFLTWVAILASATKLVMVCFHGTIRAIYRECLREGSSSYTKKSPPYFRPLVRKKPRSHKSLKTKFLNGWSLLQHTCFSSSVRLGVTSKIPAKFEPIHYLYRACKNSDITVYQPLSNNKETSSGSRRRGKPSRSFCLGLLGRAPISPPPAKCHLVLSHSIPTFREK